MAKTYMDFYNDPSIADEPKPLREVHAVRMLIAHENEGLSPAQWAEKTNARAAAIMKKYGLKNTIIKQPPSSDYPEWRQDLFKDVPLDEFLRNADEYSKTLKTKTSVP